MTDEQKHEPDSGFPYGLICAGTTDPRTLIGAMLRTLAKIDQEGHTALVLSNPIPPFVFDEGPDHRWWGSPAAQDLMLELRDLLASYAPDGYYLGFLEPDPDPAKVIGDAQKDRLLFGFWPKESWV